MLTRPDSVRYDDIVADAALAVVGAAGISALTAKNLAIWIGVTPPALSNRFGSRERVVEVVMQTTAERWCSELTQATLTARPDDPSAGLAALVPIGIDHDELRACQTLMRFSEGDPALSRFVQSTRDTERALVERVLPGTDPLDIDLAVATLRGIRESTSAGDATDAVAIMRRLCELFRTPQVEDAA